MFKTNYFRSKRTLLFKVILFCGFLYLLVSRCQKLDFSKIEIESYSAFIGCLLLTPINWFFEWLKWKLIIENIDEKYNSSNFKAFSSGIISSFLTPALSGSFLGRMLFYDKSKRWNITILSSVANFSQFLVAVLFGLLAITCSNESFPVKLNLYVFISFSIVLIIVYFFGERIADKIQIKQLQLFCDQIRKGPSRLKFLGLSLFRYIIFIIQYALALKAFGIDVVFETINYILIVFLLITLTPSLFFGKIMVRESIAVTIFGIAGYEIIPIVFASFTTWFFNLFLPAAIALLIAKKTSR